MFGWGRGEGAQQRRQRRVSVISLTAGSDFSAAETPEIVNNGKYEMF